MRTVVNPEWRDAPYELDYIWPDGLRKDQPLFPTPRFKVLPPDGFLKRAMDGNAEAMEWFNKNAVPPYVEE